MGTKRGEPIPDDLAAALTADSGVLSTWHRLRPSCQREYAAYVAEAKKPETRARRIASVLRHVAAWGERHAPVSPAG